MASLRALTSLGYSLASLVSYDAVIPARLRRVSSPEEREAWRVILPSTGFVPSKTKT